MCSCEHHWDTNAPCTCKCPNHEGIRREMADREAARGRHRKPLTDDDMANDCTHTSSTGIDTAPMGPMKVWRCDHCGLQWTEGAEVLVDGTWFPWNDLPRIAERFADSERKAWSDAKRAAIRLETAKADHRSEWADYIESWAGAVGPQPPTVESIIAAMRADSLPFGVTAEDGS